MFIGAQETNKGKARERRPAPDWRLSRNPASRTLDHRPFVPFFLKHVSPKGTAQQFHGKKRTQGLPDEMSDQNLENRGQHKQLQMARIRHHLQPVDSSYTSD